MLPSNQWPWRSTKPGQTYLPSRFRTWLLSPESSSGPSVQDLARFDPYIQDAVYGLGGINDMAFLKQEIVFHGHRASLSRVESR